MGCVLGGAGGQGKPEEVRDNEWNDRTEEAEKQQEADVLRSWKVATLTRVATWTLNL